MDGEIWTLQDGIRACQQEMLNHSPDHILHDQMIDECNKLAPLFQPKSLPGQNHAHLPKATVRPDGILFKH